MQRSAGILLSGLALTSLLCGGCATAGQPAGAAADAEQKETVADPAATTDAAVSDAAASDTADAAASAVSAPTAEELREGLGIVERCYDDLDHGPKPAECQKYIVLHDTEGESSPADTIDWWESNGSYVAAQFVVGRDGSIYQCVALDRIAHHAGFGDAGKNELFGVEDESRDDKRGTVSIGGSHPDYGMNSYSVGIEMVHVSGSGGYTEEQLAAVDGLIAYIDAYYGFESQIIDHKAWRDGNSDTSAEFAPYLANYEATRTHDGSAR